MKTTKIKIEGMNCAGCVASTRQAIQSVPGVRRVEVDLSAGRAEVEHDDQTTADALLTAVTDAGYDAQIDRG